MDQVIPQHLIDQFSAVVAQGDEQKARAFLLEHIKEFPTDSQDAIITAFVEEALSEQAKGDALLEGLKRTGLETAHTLDTIKKEAEKRHQLGAIKKTL